MSEKLRRARETQLGGRRPGRRLAWLNEPCQPRPENQEGLARPPRRHQSQRSDGEERRGKGPTAKGRREGLSPPATRAAATSWEPASDARARSRPRRGSRPRTRPGPRPQAEAEDRDETEADEAEADEEGNQHARARRKPGRGEQGPRARTRARAPPEPPGRRPESSTPQQGG